MLLGSPWISAARLALAPLAVSPVNISRSFPLLLPTVPQSRPSLLDAGNGFPVSRFKWNARKCRARESPDLSVDFAALGNGDDIRIPATRRRVGRLPRRLSGRDLVKG